VKLAIGVPTSHGFPIPVEFIESRDAMLRHLRGGGGVIGQPGAGMVTDFVQISSHAFPVDVARNQIVRRYLETDCDALLFLDADHVLPADLPDRLARHQKDVITARYHVRQPPYHANCYVSHPLAPRGEFKTVHYGHGVFEIDRGGAGALLIQRSVLEAIGGDWFRYQQNQSEGMPPDFDISEDFWFYERAKACGCSCWVDWETEVGHLATITVGKAHHEGYLSAMEAEITPVLAAHLVACGFDGPIDVGGHAVAPFHVEQPAGLERVG